MKKLSKEAFLNKAILKHGNKYDYSKVDYINTTKKVCIICSEHGEFWQSPKEHCGGQGCPKCGILSRANLRKCELSPFKQKCANVHGNKYDYSKIKYINNKIKICIICPKHGEFWQTPDAHINQKQGCPECANIELSINKTKTLSYFMEKAKYVHGTRYDYSKVEYNGLRDTINIICLEHGSFSQIAGNHLNGHGCPACSGLKIPTTDEFIQKAIKVHGDKYDYSKVKYSNNNTKICIICPKHGEFWQAPTDHVNQKQGCPICSESKLERKIRLFLFEHKINFIQQYRDKWLGRQCLDFYLPDYNIAIECQGEQHFIQKKFFGGEDGFKGTLLRDNRKRESCISNNTKLIYFTNVNIELYKDFKYKICKNESEVLIEINTLL